MLEKRSLTLAGHRTSVALEPEFWAALSTIATARGVTPLALIVGIDATRAAEQKLASALRIFVLNSK